MRSSERDPADRAPTPNPSRAREGSSLRIAGYAAIFHIEDRGGDVIEPGAFTQSLAAIEPGALPLLWQHDPLRRIGTVTYAAEDRKGLRVIAALTPEGAALARRDWHGGLSFGYRVRASEGERPRRLLQLDLVEVSLVRLPMQALAKIHLRSG
ncbi:HK97 family phage prohead protease [Novosphingopyxis sp.]|uniref:HK97 family phage prohead protease n=1 Tax=Novosphingopyxis sp. TaxID=2709690 RepID=UPI003B5C1412